MQRHPTSCRWGCLSVTALVLLAAGCGGHKVYPVQGKVVFKDGTPLTGGWVVFEPLDPNVKVSAIGDIESDGTFRLGTDGKTDGAMAGRYRVIVSPPRTSNPDEKAPEPPIIHPRYRSLHTSPLEVQVTSDKNANSFTLEIERP